MKNTTVFARSPVAAYVVSIAAVALATWARFLLDPLLNENFAFITLFVAVAYAAWYGGTGPGLVALGASVFAAGFFLLPPRFSFALRQTDQLFGLILYGVVGAALVYLVVSQRRAWQRALETTELLRTTLASIGDAVITTDVNGNISNMNAVAEALTGWRAAEALGRPLDEVFRIVNEQSREPVENPAARALREGIIVGLANHTVLIARNGSERPIDDSAAPILTSKKELLGCVLVFRDITQRKAMEDELRNTAAGLSDANRRKDEFLATLAHELRNPLAPVSNSLELMKRAVGSADLMETARSTMERQIGQMVRLIDDLLDVSRITHNKLELRIEGVELSSVVLHAAEIVRPHCERAG